MVNFISTLGTMIVTVEENNLGEKTPLSEITNIETPTVPLSLPKEGGEDGDLNPLLVLAIRDHKISQKFDAFIRVCAKHLENTQLKRSKAMYASYAKMIVQQFGENNPCLKDLDGGSVCFCYYYVRYFSVN